MSISTEDARKIEEARGCFTAAFWALAMWNLYLTQLCGVFLSGSAPGVYDRAVKHTVRNWWIVLANVVIYGVMELDSHAPRVGGPCLWALAWLAMLASMLYVLGCTAWLLRSVVKQLQKPPPDDYEYEYLTRGDSPLSHKLDCDELSGILVKLVGYKTETEATADGKKPCRRCQPQKYDYVASTRSTIFHKASCPAARTISHENFVAYATEAEAKSAGKMPASDCHP